MTYGPQRAPHQAFATKSSAAGRGAFTLLPQQHYCLMMDGAPDWPMTVRSVKVWQAPPAGGGGRQSLFHYHHRAFQLGFGVFHGLSLQAGLSIAPGTHCEIIRP